MFNGLSQSSYQHFFPKSPSAVNRRNHIEKNPATDSENNNNSRPLVRILDGPLKLSPQDPNHSLLGIPKASDLGPIWDPLAQLSMHPSVLKGTSLLPYVHSGTKFEQMLQEMLQREVRKGDKIERDEGTKGEGKMIYNGDKSRASPDRRTAATSEETAMSGVICRWCSQLFPNAVVLLQHERYLCKMNREAAEVPDHPSQALYLPRPDVKLENRKQSELIHRLPGSKSPLKKPGWPSPQPPRANWSHQDAGSPEQQMTCSPEQPSPGGRRRVPSSELGSPAGPNDPNGSPWSQSEPLDLSLPKQHSHQVEKSKIANGNAGLEERRELKRPGPTARPPPHRPVYSGAGAPTFSGSFYNGFPLFSQSALGVSGHDGIAAMPFSPPAHGPGFLPPLAYMMEADSEAALKKIHQERLMVSQDLSYKQV